MNLTKRFFWITIIVIPLFVASCGKKDNTSKPTYIAPTLKDTLIAIPDQMRTIASSGSDYYLQIGIAQIDVMNAFGLYTNYFQGVDQNSGMATTKNADGSTTYYWTNGQATIYITYSKSGGTSTWKYEVQITGQSRILYYENEESATGGTFKWYQASDVLGMTYHWEISGGTTTATLDVYDSDGTTINTEYQATSHADKSGTLIIKEKNDQNVLVQTWSITWDKNGHGSYTYNDTSGNQLASNTF